MCEMIASVAMIFTFLFPPECAVEGHFSIGVCTGKEFYRFQCSLRRSQHAYRFSLAHRCN